MQPCKRSAAANGQPTGPGPVPAGASPKRKIRGFGGQSHPIPSITHERNRELRVRFFGGSTGSHLFRHSLATQMLNQGASLCEIGDLLRHRRPDTTAIYAKVDLISLRSLALPWPGGDR